MGEQNTPMVQPIFSAIGYFYSDVFRLSNVIAVAYPKVKLEINDSGSQTGSNLIVTLRYFTTYGYFNWNYLSGTWKMDAAPLTSCTNSRIDVNGVPKAHEK